MKLDKKAAETIKETFKDAISVLEKEYSGSSLTDIFITIDRESGEIAFFDDEENKIASEIIENWVDVGEMNDNDLSSQLRNITEELDDENAFSGLDIFTPFSVNYADENLSVIEELLTINDDSVITLNNDMLSQFGKEFDEFIDKILKE